MRDQLKLDTDDIPGRKPTELEKTFLPKSAIGSSPKLFKIAVKC